MTEKPLETVSLCESLPGQKHEDTTSNNKVRSEQSAPSPTSVVNQLDPLTPALDNGDPVSLQHDFDSNAIELLAKLDEANKALENDTKSTLSSESGCSQRMHASTSSQSVNPSLRRSSITSLTNGSPRANSTLSLDTGTETISEASPAKSKFSFPSYLFSGGRGKGKTKTLLSSNQTPGNGVDSLGYAPCQTENEGNDGVFPTPPDQSWSTWGSILTEWESSTHKDLAAIKELVYKGIPQPFRAMAWQLLSGAISSSPSNSPLLKSNLYADYLKRTSPYEKLIRRDINRTYPEHSFFKEKDSAGQESLFNVMKAYSLYDQEVGYCQGSCFIVGLLLMQMPEEEAFSVLIKIMHKYNLRKLFKPSMSELALCMYQLECLIQEYIPDLYYHFQANNFYTSMYASPWFLTLFSSTLPLETAFRIMDAFLIEGINLIFRIAAAILFLCRTDLLVLDMEGMAQYIQKEMPSRIGDDPDVIFVLATSSVPFKEKQMKKVEKDFLSIKAKEQEELIQIKKLRQENRLLRQRVQYLEEESASLADRLIQGQVSRAVQAEEQFSIKRDFNELRKVLDEKEQTLKIALKQINILKKQDVEKNITVINHDKYEELIVTLQQEILAIKYREAECLSNLDDLRRKYDLLESKTLSTKMSDLDIKFLNEQLVNAKMKENDYLHMIKEFRTKLTELEGHWQQYMHWAQTNPEGNLIGNGHPLKINGFNHDSTTNPDLALNDLHDALCKRDKKLLNNILTSMMQLRISESMSFAELKDYKLRESDLRNEISMKEEQVNVATSNLTHFKEKFEEYSTREVDSKNKIKTMQCEILQLQNKLHDKEMMLKIRETELMEKCSEFQAIAMRIETERQENLLSSSLMENHSIQTIQLEKISTDSSLSGFSEFDQEITPSTIPVSQNGLVSDFIAIPNKQKSHATNTSDLTDTDSSSLISFEESLYNSKQNKAGEI